MTKLTAEQITALLRHTPSTDEEWEGRARMAEARQVAGVPLDEIDRQALERRLLRPVV